LPTAFDSASRIYLPPGSETLLRAGEVAFVAPPLLFLRATSRKRPGGEQHAVEVHGRGSFILRSAFAVSTVYGLCG